MLEFLNRIFTCSPASVAWCMSRPVLHNASWRMMRDKEIRRWICRPQPAPRPQLVGVRIRLLSLCVRLETTTRRSSFMCGGKKISQASTALVRR